MSLSYRCFVVVSSAHGNRRYTDTTHLQLTATLRNLAEVTSKRTEFISDRVLEELCGVMDMYFNDGDLMLNVVRIYR